MAARTPRNAAPRSRHNDDDEPGMTRFSSESDDDGDEDENEDEDEEEGDEDRGDDHGGSGDDDDDEDADGDDADDDDDEGDGDGQGDGSDAEDLTQNLESLQRIANEGDGMVPLARLNELLERNRRLEDHILNQQAAARPADNKPAEPEFDIKAKRRERNAALLEGDDDKVEAIEEEIDAYQQRRAEERAIAKVQEQFEQQATDAAVKGVMQSYPQLHEKHKDHDPETLEMVIVARDFFVKSKGLSKAEAIIKAAEKILGTAKAPKAERREREDDDRGSNRLQQRRQALKRAQQIPPNSNRAGGGNRLSGGFTADDVVKLPDSKFDALDKKDKAAARGDHDVPNEGRARRAR